MSYDLIIDLIAMGQSQFGIFTHLQENGVFNESADYSGFFKALQREKLRRRNRDVSLGIGVNLSKYVAGIELEKPNETRVLTTDSQMTVVPSFDSGNASVLEGIEYERGGKRYVYWQGKELEIPTGFIFLRGRICPEVDDRRLDNKNERQFSFEDYPQHIQDAINESSRNGTVLEDAEKNRRLIEEWKAGLKQ